MKEATKHFLINVIDPVVLYLGFESDKSDSRRITVDDRKLIPVSALLLGTALAESNLTHVKQMGGGPALGYFQIEPATHDDIWKNWLAYREETRMNVLALATTATPDFKLLKYSQSYGCALARCHYRRMPGRIPDTIEEQADYWKKHYNTPSGKGTVEHYLEAWENR